MIGVDQIISNHTEITWNRYRSLYHSRMFYKPKQSVLCWKKIFLLMSQMFNYLFIEDNWDLWYWSYLNHIDLSPTPQQLLKVSLPFVYTKSVQQNLKTSLMWHGRRLKRRHYWAKFSSSKLENRKTGKRTILPVFAASRQAGRFTLWILKHVQKYRLEFTKNHSRHFEIPLKPTDAVAKILREIRHVRPFLHLAEELDQTERK